MLIHELAIRAVIIQMNLIDFIFNHIVIEIINHKIYLEIIEFLCKFSEKILRYYLPNDTYALISWNSKFPNPRTVGLATKYTKKVYAITV